MKRRDAREKALQALYQIDMSGSTTADALDFVLDEEKNDPFLESLIEGTINHLTEIDEHINQHLENWSIERLAKVDLNILRMGVYELLFSEDVPANVAINEAIEVAKRFGDDHSSKFVNGILSKIKDGEQA